MENSQIGIRTAFQLSLDCSKQFLIAPFCSTHSKSVNQAFASSDLGFALLKRTQIASLAFARSLASLPITAIGEHNHSLHTVIVQLLSPLQKPRSLTALYQQTPVFETKNCTLTNRLGHSHFWVS